MLVSDLPAYPAGGRIRREHPAPRPGACRADLRDGDGDWYAEIEIATEVAGAPILTDRIVDRIDCGDHVIVLDEVLSARVLPDEGEPLVFFRGRYRLNVAEETPTDEKE